MKKYLLPILMMMMVLAACSEEDDTAAEAEEEEERVVAVEVVEAEEGDLTIEKSIYGRTAPNSTTPLIVQTPGEVEELEVANGDRVEEDDLIATIFTAAGNQNVRATTDGEIINLQVSEGDMADTEEPIAMVSDLDTMQIQFSTTANVRALFSVDDTVTALIEDSEYEATITKIDTLPDDKGLYPIVATVETEEADILPGIVAEIRVPEEKIASAILIPTSALAEEDGETYVYTVNDNLATKVMVDVLETQSDVTAIEGDIQTGEQVVTTGQLMLIDGAQVDITGGE
ncbi:efflux RND transporter periplasmic adaptor subunit [Oceanobacillus salinisoli]|uniref:efflux RND transporter periplasmic adaptor subunit n=1 Tax=Oceanobacillus salinisoli TaxID=2678611 RepID=UPI0012E2366E|nr:HlyD family efflux transporter periplasmic adaptor subunit [Oceanobacillus salinisoli]